MRKGLQRRLVVYLCGGRILQKKISAENGFCRRRILSEKEFQKKEFQKKGILPGIAPAAESLFAYACGGCISGYALADVLLRILPLLQSHPIAAYPLIKALAGEAAASCRLGGGDILIFPEQVALFKFRDFPLVTAEACAPCSGRGDAL